MTMRPAKDRTKPSHLRLVLPTKKFARQGTGGTQGPEVTKEDAEIGSGLLGSPSWFNLALEPRFMIEALHLAWSWQQMLRTLPSGDGHCIIVLPGLGASDHQTLPMRQFLCALGYDVQPWGLGMNRGPRVGVIEACMANVASHHERSGSRVTLLGWSLGGVYAREIAKLMPGRVRRVITLGSPLRKAPGSTNADWLFRTLSGFEPGQHPLAKQLHVLPDVPLISIYSKSDGVVGWWDAVHEHTDLAQSVEVRSSHLGLVLNPLVLSLVAQHLGAPSVKCQGAPRSVEPPVRNNHNSR